MIKKKTERLQLIRERYRKLILQPRMESELALRDDWDDDFDLSTDEILPRELLMGTEEDEE